MAGFLETRLQSLPNISERERQLIALSAEGHTDVEIAHELCISPATVNVYWTRLRQKLGAKSRTEAVAVALRSQAETEHRKLEHRYEQVQKESAGIRDLAGTLNALVDEAPDGILLADQHGCLTYLNRALARMFGYAPEELVGAHLSKLVPDRFREEHAEHVQDFGAHPEQRRMGHGLFVTGLRKDGSEIAVCVTLSGLDSGAERTTIAIVRDYTKELDTIRRLEDETAANS